MGVGSKGQRQRPYSGEAVSEHSDKFNTLPIEQRQLLSAMLIEEQIRIIQQENVRLRVECNKAIKANSERQKRMREHLATLEKKP